MSNLIKSFHYTTLGEKHRLRPAGIQGTAAADTGEADSGQDTRVDAQLAAEQALKAQIIADAEEQAQRILEQARNHAETTKATAQQEIDSWWENRRTSDEAAAQEAARAGFEQGLVEGRASAEEEVQHSYRDMIEKSRSILEEAMNQKQRLVQEAEPFLLDLSLAIARKIVTQQVRLQPETILDMIRGILQRRKEQGAVTLSVSPEWFSFVQDARDELLLSMDAQADLVIVPDQRVQDEGCIVRSSFGSIDARVDTQLAEIKAVLVQLAVEHKEGTG